MSEFLIRCPKLPPGWEPERDMRSPRKGEKYFLADGTIQTAHSDHEVSSVRIILIDPEDWFVWRKGDPRPLTMPVGCQYQSTFTSKWKEEAQRPQAWVCQPRRWRKSLNPGLQFEGPKPTATCACGGPGPQNQYPCATCAEIEAKRAAIDRLQFEGQDASEMPKKPSSVQHFKIIRAPEVKPISPRELQNLLWTHRKDSEWEVIERISEDQMAGKDVCRDCVAWNNVCAGRPGGCAKFATLNQLT